jgi:hypothetical protein
MLARIRGESDPVALLSSVPGIGKKTAERLHHDLGIDTLEELETAAHDGRLAQIAGIGQKKVAGVADSLAARLGRIRRGRRDATVEEPSVPELLAVDQEYRQAAQAGRLKKIAPRRLNPTGQAWLPVLHTQRGEWHYTTMFSNTSRAHQLGRTGDWVVLYCEADDTDQQYTVITSQRGPLEGKRIVRGRESECALYYQSIEGQQPKL